MGSATGDVLKSVGSRLRELRRRRGMTLVGVAERIGSNESTLSRLEGRDSSSRTLDLLLPLAHVYRRYHPPRANRVAGPDYRRPLSVALRLFRWSRLVLPRQLPARRSACGGSHYNAGILPHLILLGGVGVLIASWAVVNLVDPGTFTIARMPYWLLSVVLLFGPFILIQMFPATHDL